MPARQEIEVEGRKLSVSNLDKVLYPEVGFTKGQVIDYYARIAPVMLPHLQGHPVTLKRYPNGVDAGFFFEKNCPSHRPDWVGTIPMRTEANGGTTNFCAVNDAATLVWLANLAAIELHPNLQTVDDLDTPTVMVFDLDPGAPADIIDCARVALRLRSLFESLGLQAFPKTSGSKGMQIYVPLHTPVTFDDTGAFAKAVGQLLEKETPDEVLVNMTRELRPGKIFVDWSQNNYIKTTVSAYSLRAKSRPTVSTPLFWEEVEKGAGGGSADDLAFTTDEVLKRVRQHGDLFAPVLNLEQELPKFG